MEKVVEVLNKKIFFSQFELITPCLKKLMAAKLKQKKKNILEISFLEASLLISISRLGIKDERKNHLAYFYIGLKTRCFYQMHFISII